MSKKRYVVQESGQVTLPADMRRQYDLKKGDEILWEETEQGWLARPAISAIEKFADEIAQELTDNGVDLEELMASGREERRRLLKELYDIDAD